jgi:hypothetical protein
VGSGYRGVELHSLLVRGSGLPVAGMGRALAAACGCDEQAVASLQVAPAGDGFERVTLPAATPEQARRVTSALAEALAGGAPVLAFAPGRGGGRLSRVLGRRPPAEALACALPAAFAGERTEELLGAWRRHVGPARVVDDDARSGPAPVRYETSVRAVWV